MPVQLDDEPKAIERAVKSLDGSLHLGAACDVEFGACWAYRGREPIRIGGIWYRCRVVSHEGAIVHVTRDPR